MNKNTGIVIGVIVLLVIIGGVYASMNKRGGVVIEKEKMEQKAMEDQKMAEEKMMMEKKAMEEKNAMMKKDDGAMMKKEESSVMMSVNGSYTNYDQSRLINAEKGDVVLFFHASWCPKCVTSDKNFKATTTPDGLTLLKVDFDNSTALRQKYGVTLQHTFVQVDKGGDLIKKWNGSYTYNDLKAQIN